MAGQIAKGECGIENMDAKYLAEDLIENEPGLFDGEQPETKEITDEDLHDAEDYAQHFDND